MNNSFTVRCVLHKDLQTDELEKIISLKMQHWKYCRDSQNKWIINNINPNDIHLMILIEGDNLIAYLNIVDIVTFSNDEEISYFGVGNVCVDQKFVRLGYGFLLMQVSRFILKQFGMPGILICKKYLIEFYLKGGWLLYNGLVTIQGKDFDGALLSTENIATDKIVLPRNF